MSLSVDLKQRESEVSQDHITMVTTCQRKNNIPGSAQSSLLETVDRLHAC